MYKGSLNLDEVRLKKSLKILRWIAVRPLVVFLLFFACTGLTTIFIQFIALPYLFPQWHYGHGLLKPPGDWVGFHEAAAENARAIRMDGWNRLNFFPREGGAIVGIVTVLYVLVTPEPWVLIPLHAGMHAAAALCFFLISIFFVSNRVCALLGAIAFLVYPSSLLWTAQIHRDGYSILGFSLILLGFSSLVVGKGLKRVNTFEHSIGVRSRSWRVSFCAVVPSTLLVLLGIGFIGLSRSYLLQVLYYLGITLFPFLVWVLARALQRSLISLQVGAGIGIAYGLLLICLASLGKYDLEVEIPVMEENSKIEEPKSKHPLLTFESQNLLTLKSNNYRELVIQDPGIVSSEPHFSTVWKKTPFLPKTIEQKFYCLGSVRDGFRHTHLTAATNIDLHVRPGSAKEIISYFPRAAQIGFLSPFPVDWDGRGSVGPGKMMRRIAALEMIGIYLGLIFFLVVAWEQRRRIEFWTIALFCTAITTMYGLVITNVGSLHRVRYGFLMGLVVIGLGKFFEAVQEFLRKELPPS